ncbi:MAG TPA: SIS domain-containing protein [Baekduia sp.]|uniref:SIS domain-containing protein n=1 Tax=Baekduia sp. TaxID=2600305 RepID=UPI002D779208|nr:SIS domain-containing protein [Baekduia sp.]HET6509519.1 SIS domain-containing protein [Baekduia sp.]
MTYAATYLGEVADIAATISADHMERMAHGIAAVRERGGRLFIVGVGGGAGHASHAVNDFRKIAHIESYTPTDNVSELTARVNDDSWESSYSAWLRTSRIDADDALLVFSVGGGSKEHNISMNLVAAMDLAVEVGAPIYAIVGKADGHAAQVADVAIVVESPAARRTPHVESFQAILWHLVVSHPAVEAQPGKWEEVDGVGAAAGS